MPSRSPLFGRDAELGELFAALEVAAGGSGQLVLITGEAGIGKTRLADELASRHTPAGVRAVWGRCWEGGGAPAYWPWIQALRGLRKMVDLDRHCERVDPGGVDLAPLLGGAPQPAPEDAASHSEHDRFRLFDTAVRLLAEVASESPLLVILDDLHAADPASLRLLQLLTQELRQLPIMVVGTLREPGGPSSGESAGLLALLRRASRVIALDGLDVQDVASFIEARSGATVAPSIGAAVTATTNGNPFFVDEVVRLLVSERRLGSGGLDAVLRSGLPGQLREVIWRRLDPLPEPVLQILSAAAVLGRDFDIETLADVVGTDSDDVLDLLTPAVVAGVLADPSDRSGRWTFRHGLIREALYHQLSTAQRVRLHRKAGQSLEDRPTEDLDARLPQLAHHFLQAAGGGDVAKAFAYSCRAGDAARAVLAFEEAVTQYSHALSLADASQVSRSRRTELLLALASVQGRAGSYEEAQSTWRDAATSARFLGDPDQFGRAAIGYALSGMLFGITDPVRVALLEEALRLQGTAPSVTRAQLLARLAGELYWSNERERSVELSEEAVAISRELGDSAVEALTLQALHYARRGPDNITKRIRLAERSIVAAEAAGDAELVLSGRAALVTDLLESAALGRMDAEVDALDRAANQLHHPAFRWYTAVYRLVRALLDGRFGEADKLSLEAEHAGRRAPEFAHGLFFARRLTDLREDGEPSDHTARLEEMAERFPGVYLWRALLALRHAHAGRVEEARTELGQLTSVVLEANDHGAHWLMGVALLAELAAALKDVGAAESLADVLRPYAGRLAVAGRVAACRGAVDHALGLLASTTGEADAAIAYLRDAVAIHRRLGTKAYLARSLAALGEVLQTRGGETDAAAAIQSLDEAIALAERLGLSWLVAQSRATRDRAASARGGAWHGVCVNEGEFWSVGDEQLVVRLAGVRGLAYLARLLAQPGVAVHALDLVSGSGYGRATPATDHELPARVGGDAGVVLDARARAAYRNRLTALKSERRNAEALRDSVAVATLTTEGQAIERALAGGVGLGGRGRLAASDAERARVSVRKALTVTLRRISAVHPRLGDHLAACVRTGTYCSYEPDPRAPVHWRLS